MNNRFQKAVELLTELKTVPNMLKQDNAINTIKQAFEQTSLLDQTRSQAATAVYQLRMKLLEQQRRCQHHWLANDNTNNTIRIIDNNLLLLAQYFPSNSMHDTTTAYPICPLSYQAITPENYRFVLSNGMHLSLNGIIDYAKHFDIIRINTFHKDDNITLTDRDKDRLELFLLKYRQNKAQSKGQRGVEQ